MASQIAHIIYTQKFFSSIESGEIISKLGEEERDKYPLGKINKDEFFLGSVFPDIRRVDENIRRKDTHLYFPKINLDFSGLTHFEAGWKFHLYCDMKREELLNKYGFYSLENTTDFYNLPAKIWEDELVYDYYNNWEKLVNFFNSSPKIKIDFHVRQESIDFWYAILAKYFEKKPDNKSMRAFLLKQPSLVKKVDGVMACIENLRKNKKAAEIINKIKEEII